jgi:hypothetical protein
MADKTENSNEMFTFFGKGHFSEKAQKWVPSTTPQQIVDVGWCGQYILSERAKWPTDELRRLLHTVEEQTEEQKRAKDQMLRDFKLRMFDAVAGAGSFSYGNAKGLICRSRFIVLDIDDLESTEEARDIQQTLIKDKNVETALCFLSPKGLGIKLWAELPEWCQNMTFAEQYAALSRYIGFEYGILADSTGSNVNRLCFLPYDPLCYINPKYSINQ